MEERRKEGREREQEREEKRERKKGRRKEGRKRKGGREERGKEVIKIVFYFQCLHLTVDVKIHTFLSFRCIYNPI